MNDFERRFRKFSITNLTMYIIMGKIFVFCLVLFKIPFVESLMLIPERVMAGEVWRLVTFMFFPRGHVIFFIFEIMFFYWIGRGLEEVWGSFRYTMYFVGAIVGVAVATIIAYYSGFIGGLVTISYVPTLFTYTMFLPFAWYFGEEEIRAMLIFPIKIKYLAIIDLLLILELFIELTEIPGPPLWPIYVASMMNMIVFFVYVLFARAKQRKRSADFRQGILKVEKARKKKSLHRCTVCGITENEDPGMSFRYCSKCQGNYEYCEEHLKTHEHRSNIVDFKKPD